MKKIFLFVAMAAMFSACSGDDDSKKADKNAPVVVTIDGKKTAFNNVTTHIAGYRIYVTAMTDNNAEVLKFESDMGYTGDDSIYYMEYVKGQKQYSDYDSPITSNVEVNTEYMLKGTFHGSLVMYDDEGEATETVTLTNGSFNIAHEQE